MQSDIRDLLTRALAHVDAPDPGPTLADALADYEATHWPSWSAGSRRVYEALHRALRQTALAPCHLAEITPADVQREIAIASHGRAARCQLARLIDRVCRHAQRPSPASGLHRYRSPVPDGALDADQVRRLVSVLLRERDEDRRPWLCLAWLAHTGHRVGEALRLRADDVDERGSTVWLRSTKNGESQRRPVARAAIAIAWAACPGHSGHVFRDDEYAPRSAYDRLRKRVMPAACEEAGIRRIRVHDLRHTAATLLAASGLPLRDVQIILGHRSASSTIRYLHGDARRQRAAVDALGQALAGQEVRRG